MRSGELPKLILGFAMERARRRIQHVLEQRIDVHETGEDGTDIQYRLDDG